MPKTKSPPNKHKDKEVKTAKSHSHHQHKEINMDKVKIKRIKRNKKEITTAEKIMAGIGVGSSLMGGAGAVKPQPPTNQFVRTQETKKGSASDKIKGLLSSIFGVNTAEAAGINPATMQWDPNYNPYGGNSGSTGTGSTGAGGSTGTQGGSTGQTGNTGNNTTQLTPDQLAQIEAARQMLASGNGTPEQLAAANKVYYQHQFTTPADPSGGGTGDSGQPGSGSKSDAIKTTPIDFSNSGASTTAQNFIQNSGSLTLADFNALSPEDQAAVTNYFNTNPVSSVVPSKFDNTSFLAYGLSLGGQTTTTINGVTYTLNDVGQWVSSDPAPTGTIVPEPLTPIDPATIDPVEGDTKVEGGFTYTFYQGGWVLNNGQTKTEGGINYGSNGGGWILLDGQTKTENGHTYHSSGGEWVEDASATPKPIIAELKYDTDAIGSAKTETAIYAAQTSAYQQVVNWRSNANQALENWKAQADVADPSTVHDITADEAVIASEAGQANDQILQMANDAVAALAGNVQVAPKPTIAELKYDTDAIGRATTQNGVLAAQTTALQQITDWQTSQGAKLQTWKTNADKVKPDEAHDIQSDLDSINSQAKSATDNVNQIATDAFNAITTSDPGVSPTLTQLDYSSSFSAILSAADTASLNAASGDATASINSWRTSQMDSVTKWKTAADAFYKTNYDISGWLNSINRQANAATAAVSDAVANRAAELKAASSTAPKEGDKGTQKIGNVTINTTFYQGNWVVNDGQVIDGASIGKDAGVKYGSAHNVAGTLVWMLEDGQHKTDSAGKNYTSSGGVWVLDSNNVTGKISSTYTISNGVPTFTVKAADGTTKTYTNAQYLQLLQTYDQTSSGTDFQILLTQYNKAQADLKAAPINIGAPLDSSGTLKTGWKNLGDGVYYDTATATYSNVTGTIQETDHAVFETKLQLSFLDGFTFKVDPNLPGGTNHATNTIYNTYQYADQQTALTLARAMGLPASAVSQTLVSGPVSPYPQYVITFPNGVVMNAGLVAQVFLNNTPSVATQMIQAQANTGGAGSYALTGVNFGDGTAGNVNPGSGTGGGSTSSGGTVITGPAVGSVTLSSTFKNLSYSDSGTLAVGDKWELDVTGPAGQNVYITGGKVVNGKIPTDTTPFGQIPSSGVLVLTGQITSDQVGVWNQTVKVGTSASTATPLSQALIFTVVANRTTSTTSTSVLPAGFVVPVGGFTPGTLLPNGLAVDVNGNIIDSTGKIVYTAAQNRTGGTVNSTGQLIPGSGGVTDPNAQSGAVAPTIGSLSVSQGKAGDVVTITGTNFNSVITNNQIEFLNASGAVVASTAAVSGTTSVLQFTVPSNLVAGSYGIRVTNLSARVGTTTNYTMVSSATQAFTVLASTGSVNPQTVSITGLTSFDTAGNNSSGVLKTGYTIEIAGNNLTGAYNQFYLNINGQDYVVSKVTVTNNKITLYPTFDASIPNGSVVKVKLGTNVTGVSSGLINNVVFIYNQTAGSSTPGGVATPSLQLTSGSQAIQNGAVLPITIGQSVTINGSVTVYDTATSNFTVTSSNPSIASVTLNAGAATITGVGAGYASITFHPTASGTSTAQDKVIFVSVTAPTTTPPVTDPNAPDSEVETIEDEADVVNLMVSANSVNLTAGSTGTVTTSVMNNGAVDHNVTAVSDSSNVLVSVNSNTGIVSIFAISPGVAHITVHPVDLVASDTSQDEIITVTVTSPVVTQQVSMTLSSNTVNVAAGASGFITASVTTNGVLNHKVSAVSSSSNVLVSVNPTTGIVTVYGINPGTANITIHPIDLASTNTSQDQIVAVTVTSSTVAQQVSLSLTSNSVNVVAGTSGFVTASVTTNGVLNHRLSAVSDSSNVLVSVDPATGIISLVGVNAGTANITIHPTDLISTDTSQDQVIVVTVTATANGGGSSTVSDLQNTIAGLNNQISQLQNQIAALNNRSGTVYVNSTDPTQLNNLQNQVQQLTSLVQSLRSGQITTYGQVSSQPFQSLQMPVYSSGSTSQGLQMPAGYDASNGGPAFQGLQNQGYNTATQGLQYQAPAQVQGATTAGSYTVKKGDTLFSIAKKYYGNGSQWRKVLSANPKCLSKAGNTKTLKIGFVLNMPSL